jgi:hypothetical protein
MVFLGLLHALHAQLMLWSSVQLLAVLEITKTSNAHKDITMILHHSSSTPMMMPSAISSATAPQMSSECPVFSFSSLLFTALDL